MPRERARGEIENRSDVVGVLQTPGPDVTRRPKAAGSRVSRGSQRNIIEIFNIQHAAWAGKEHNPEYSALNPAQSRAVRRKIRKALYAVDGEFVLEKGKHTYREIVKEQGQKLSSLRKKLDASFTILAMAEGSWAADMFIQEVFKTDRTYKKASSSWIHPRNRSTTNHSEHRAQLFREEENRRNTEGSDLGGSVLGAEGSRAVHNNVTEVQVDRDNSCTDDTQDGGYSEEERENTIKKQERSGQTASQPRQHNRNRTRRPRVRVVDSDEEYENYLADRLENLRRKRRCTGS